MASQEVKSGEAWGILGTIVVFGIFAAFTFIWATMNLPYAEFMGWGAFITGMVFAEVGMYLVITNGFDRYDVVIGVGIPVYLVGVIFNGDILPVGSAYLMGGIYGGVLGMIVLAFLVLLIFFGLYEVLSVVKKKRIG